MAAVFRVWIAMGHMKIFHRFTGKSGVSRIHFQVLILTHPENLAEQSNQFCFFTHLS
jgi:hypothetical protein